MVSYRKRLEWIKTGKPIKKMFRYKGWLARNGEYTPIETLGTEEGANNGR